MPRSSPYTGIHWLYADVCFVRWSRRPSFSARCCAILVASLRFFFRRINSQTGLKELDPGPLGVEFHCNVCGRDVSIGQWRVRCAECYDFDLCIPCFAYGKETGTHLNTHSYLPVAPNTMELFAPSRFPRPTAGGRENGLLLDCTSQSSFMFCFGFLTPNIKSTHRPQSLCIFRK